MTTDEMPRRRFLAPLPAAAGLGAVMALSGCFPATPEVAKTATNGTTSNGTTPPLGTQNPGLVAGVDIPAGQIDDAVAKLPELVAAIMARTKIPGLAVSVTHQGRTVFAQGFGVRKVGESAVVGPDTVFQLASLSKSVGATVVACEVANGTVGWDTPLVANLPHFALADPWIGTHATVGDMYSHRSGLPDHAGDDLEEIGYDRATIIERLKFAPLDGFRTADNYTNFGVTAAAESVAAAAKLDWAALSERNIYTTLGMGSTSSRFADFAARADRAWGHVLADGKYQPLYQRQPDQQSPAGGVSSSVKDMAVWAAMVLGEGTINGRQIVERAALTPALTPQFVSSPAQNSSARGGLSGFGFNVGNLPTGRTLLSHSGAFALGAGTCFSLLPSEALGIVVLTNAAPTGAAESLAMEFLDLVQYGRPKFDWWALYKPKFDALNAAFGALVGKTAPASARPAPDNDKLVGSYSNDFYGSAEIKAVDGGLKMVVGPAAVSYSLQHWDAGIFVAPLQSENAEPGSLSQLEFTLGADGRAGSFVFEYFNRVGLGTFTR